MSFIMTFSMRTIFFSHCLTKKKRPSAMDFQFQELQTLRYKLSHPPRNKAQIRSSNQPNTISQYRFIGLELDINITCHKSAM